MGTQGAQGVEIGRVEEAVGGIVGDGDGPTGQQRRHDRRRGGGEFHQRGQFRRAGGGEMIGDAIQALSEIGNFAGLQQAQMALGQRRLGISGDGAVKTQAGRQTSA